MRRIFSAAFIILDPVCATTKSCPLLALSEHLFLRAHVCFQGKCGHDLLRRKCPLLAQSGHPSLHRTCPLLGVKQTSEWSP
jgi:hypothetical protein